MAKILLAEYVSLNAADLSTYARKAELAIAVEDKEVTTYGSAGWKEFLGGLKAGTLNIEFLNDFALASIDNIMFPLLGTVVAFDVRASSTARSTSNPSYTGFCLIDQWNPITGSVGSEASVSVGYPTSGAVARQIV